ncbi:MAG: SRPBCC domain-containing protein [Flavobacteriaceae bacterium]|nr:SRPBCC domain-containing protein [Candidatus Onthonaster equi]
MLGNPLTITKEYKCSIKELWNAITNPEALKDWYFDLKGFELVQGNEFEFYAGKYLHHCEIKEIFLYHKLTYSWTYPMYEGNSQVTFIINPINDDQTTQLELVHEGIASFPQDDSNFSRASFEAGWEELLELMLRQYVEVK